jgi:transposase
MKVQHSKFDELRIQFVEEALDRGNIALTARIHGISPRALHGWVKQYRDEVELTMSKKKSVDKLNDPLVRDDWKEKYEQATKLIGEKELEIAVLRDLVKKKHPNHPWKWPENGS